MKQEYSCQDCQPRLLAFAQGLLPRQEMEPVRKHLVLCNSCAKTYLDLIFAGEIRGKGYLYDRPMWGPYVLNYEEERILVSKIKRQALSGGTTGPKLILVKYQQYLEKVALSVQMRVSAQLRQRGMNVSLFHNPGRLIAGMPVLDSASGPLCLVLPHASSVADFPELLDSIANRDVTLIAGFPEDAWGEMEVPFNSTVHNLSLPEEKYEAVERALNRHFERIPSADLEGAFRYVALLDHLHILTPESVLLRLAKADEIGRMLDSGVIYQLKKKDKNTGLFCTRGEVIGRKLADSLAPADMEKAYSELAGSINPAIPYERHLLVMMVRALGFRGRITTARTIVRLFPDKISALVGQSIPRHLLVAGKTLQDVYLYAEADDAFRHGLELEPDNIFLLHAHARLLSIVRKYDEADACFQRLRSITPSNPYLWQSWAEVQVRKGAVRQAESMFLQALELDPENVKTRISHGNFRLSRRDTATALKELSRARCLSRHNPYVLNSLGMLYLRLRRYVRARGYFVEVLRIDPCNLPALHSLGRLHLDRGHLAHAARIFEMAKSAYPDNIHSLHLLGEVAMEQARIDNGNERYKKAAHYFQRVLDIDGNNVESLVSLSVLYRRLGDYTRAKSFLGKAKELQHRNPYILVSEGRLHAAIGDMAAAETRFREAISMDDRDPVPLVELARLLAPTHTRKSRQLFRDALKIEPRNPITLNSWADAECTMGNTTKAERLLTRSLRIDPENAYTLSAMARLLGKKGDRDGALSYSERALGYFRS